MSRQQFHQKVKKTENEGMTENEIIHEILKIRCFHPVLGLKKMYKMLEWLPIGRDAFLELGKKYGLEAKKIKSFKRTTYSTKSSFYENLLCQKTFQDINMVWVTDITYFRVLENFYYISLMMDLYSRKIIAYKASETLEAKHSVEVLENAFKKRDISKNELIHHSDKGTQYFSNAYTKLLENKNVKISACQIVHENAHAERLNGIIKNEYLVHYKIKNYNDLIKYLDKAVDLYNNKRPHASLNFLTPDAFEKNLKNLDTQNRYILSVFTDNFDHNP